MLKPAFKSLEGQSVGVVLLGGLALLREVLSGSNVKIPPAEELVKYADSAKELATALSAGNAVDLATFASTGKTGIILFFMYKIYTRFLDSRTDLKKKALEMGDTQA